MTRKFQLYKFHLLPLPAALLQWRMEPQLSGDPKQKLGRHSGLFSLSLNPHIQFIINRDILPPKDLTDPSCSPHPSCNFLEFEHYLNYAVAPGGSPQCLSSNPFPKM
ncbi:unnamed protein product [Rangifer tarandus platyrhynchus]|uniref:Uncharacterized protein n=2 Tax=Rangifer tarandus platyrhynchus TaxID=3082113 RepID=A0AC60A200_RANTA|nr:unnamed protein product [Rangifer tarandus platyrhynchus]